MTTKTATIRVASHGLWALKLTAHFEVVFRCRENLGQLTFWQASTTLLAKPRSPDERACCLLHKTPSRRHFGRTKKVYQHFCKYAIILNKWKRSSWRTPENVSYVRRGASKVSKAQSILDGFGQDRQLTRHSEPEYLCPENRILLEKSPWPTLSITLPLLWFIQNADNKLPIIKGPGHEQPRDVFILACQQEDCVSHQTEMVY